MVVEKRKARRQGNEYFTGSKGNLLSSRNAAAEDGNRLFRAVSRKAIYFIQLFLGGACSR